MDHLQCELPSQVRPVSYRWYDGGMAKDKISATIDHDVILATDEDAAELGLNRSEYIERVLRHEHTRRQLEQYKASPMKRIIDDYAARLDEANRKAGLL
jgi:hypothetical protein